MNRFSRIRHHVDMKDVKRRHLEELAAKKNKEKQIEEERILRQKIYNACKSNWREDILDEGMTTGNVFSTTLSAEGETAIDTVNPIDPASFTGTTGVINPGDDLGANVGTVIRDNGTGIGADGGFNVGGQYLAFQGVGSGSNNTRFAALSPIDSSQVDTLSITAIVGNDVNGGEDPDLTSEGLLVMYKTPAMANATFLAIKPNNTAGEGDGVIIPSPASHDGGLNNYSIKIPEYARAKGTQFILMQIFNSGSEFDHYGITNINFKRKAPLSVIVPLDDPSAISFISVGTNEGDPKKRKKKINDQLEASDKYTKSVMGSQFPGQGTRIDGDDPFRSTTVTSDDDIKASPIGSDEVKKEFGAPQLKSALGQPATINKADPQAKVTDIIKSGKAKPETGQPQSGKDFSTFKSDTENVDAPVETEVEIEPTTPSTQTSLTPKTDDGEDITVRSVGGRNSNAVQGADAANIDAQQQQEPEIEQPEVEEPEVEEIKTDDVKASDKEKDGKSESEVQDIERDKFNTQFNKQTNFFAKQIINQADKLLDMPVNRFVDFSVGVIKVLRGINQGGAALAKLGGLVGGLTDEQNAALKHFENNQTQYEKLINSANIFRSTLTGRIEAQDYSPFQIGKLTSNLKPAMFIGEEFYKERGGNFGISDTRHEYADDNIYVLDGKVYNNTDGNRKGVYATPLANMGVFTPEIDGIGRGYGQMIIPKDGSAPYFHYYDYNYYNLNSTDAGEIPDQFQQFFADLAGAVRKVLPGRLFNDAVNRFEGNLNTFNNNLKNRVGLDGWPPGIHGATLHDFKIPVSDMSEEMQEMIGNHPLSWTPERIANMSSDDFIDEMISRTEDITSPDELTSAILKALEDPDSEVDPEFLRIYKRSNVIQDDYDKAVEELDKVRNTPEYNAASDAALKEYKDINAERKEKIAENDEKFGNKALLNLWEKLVGPYYRAVGNVIRGGGSISKNDPTYQKMINGNKEYEKQVKVLQKKYAQGEKNIVDKYKKLLDEAYAKYNDTITVKKLDDGTFGMVNGGDFTTKDGEVIPGKRTLSAKQQAKFDEVKAEQDEIREYFRTANFEDNMIKPFVLYDVRTKFSKYGMSGESWSPEKKGSGLNTPPSSPPNIPPSSSPKPYDPFANEVKPNLGAKPGDDIAFFGGKNPVDNLRYDPNHPDGTNQPNPFKPGTPLYKNFEKQRQYDELGILGSRNTGSSGLGSVASVGGVDATAAATAAAASRRDRRRKTSMVAHYKPIGTNLFERIKSKPFFNPKDIKPPFPENDPPQLDPKTGMHPRYGKQAGRYKKLDPISANAMPPTGDPEIDAVVDKQRTKPKSQLFSKIKGLRRKD